MKCPQCELENPPGTHQCSSCNTPLEYSGATSAGATSADSAVQGWSDPATGSAVERIPVSLASLGPGSVLGGRYEILQLLGEGGMGAVYKARDREVDRLVALKVIRPQLAGNREMLQRFKQELILARQVTHKNVIRIFDLGEADGIKFITMEFIEGQDLKTFLTQKGALTPVEAVSIIRQVCQALSAAHEEGVVHRDLKPQNVMIDKQGKVSVMDFGIARSIELGGMTQSGALVGTPEYMSPEQVRGEEVDARSDLFTLGIIFYELLIGKMPYKADTAMATMFKRTQERAVPPAQVNAAVPMFLSDVVARCLEIDLKRRYQSAREILQDLGAYQGGTTTAHAVAVPQPTVAPLRLYWKWIAAGLAVLLLVVIGVVFRQKLPFGSSLKPGASTETISLAVLPFRNASGDPALDWLGSGLAEMLRTDVGQSSQLRMVSSDRLHQILKDLRVSHDTELDPATLRRVAEFTSADRLLWGQYIKVGNQIRIDATLQDLKRDRTIPLKVEAANEKELLKSVDQLAQSIQQNLALSPAVVKELSVTAFTPSSKSVQALRYYSEGLELARQGNHLEALKRFQASSKEDPSFALAYSKLAQSYATLGYGKQAEQFSSKAVELSENLPQQERLRILASHSSIMNDVDRAIESYENLAKLSPDDSQVQFDLAGLYEGKGAFDQARNHYARVLAGDPKFVDALYAAGRVEMKARNFQGALDYLNRALSFAIQLDNPQAKATILQSIGICYKRLNKLDEALRNYQESLAIKQRIGDRRGIAVSLKEIAQVKDRLGRSEEAKAGYLEALKMQREIGDKKGIGLTLADLGIFLQNHGQYDDALKISKEALQVHQELGDENYQASSLNNIGAAYFLKGQYDDALTYYQRALELRQKLKVPNETAVALYNLGETYAQIGQYDQSLTHYLRALEIWRGVGDKRAAAIASYGMGTLFTLQGRYGAALNANEEALKTFRELQDRDFWLGEILAGYGNALSLMGRGDEAQRNLEVALKVARDLKDNTLTARILNFQGDRVFYRGDLKSARPLYEQALQAASRPADRQLTLTSKMNLAKVAVEEHHGPMVVGTLKTLVREAETLRLKYLSSECSIYLGEALLDTKNYAAAREELEAALRKSESLGSRTLVAKSHYLLAKVLPYTGNKAGATRHYQEARKLLEEMRAEAHSDALLKREDLRAIYEETTRLSQNPQN